MLSTRPVGDETLAAIGQRIQNSFESLESDARVHEGEDSFFSALVNESQRFGLWAKNLGLYCLGHSSLDYRFRDAPRVYQYTLQLLGDLENSILKIQQAQKERKAEQRMTWVHYHSPKGISGEAAGLDEGFNEVQANEESSEDEEDLASYQENPLCDIVLENAKITINRLYKLSFKIRNPATRLGFSKARSYRAIDEETGEDVMEWYAYFDLRHVAEIIARHWRISPEECEKHELVQRLARANTNRRRQFGHWRRHKLKLESIAKVIKNPEGNKSNMRATPSLLEIPQGSEKGPLSLPSAATRCDENNVDPNDTASAISTSTFAIFTEDDDSDICIPPLPGKLCTGKEFECPFCHILCSTRSSERIAWERHVFKDLRPYVCTYVDCAEGDQQYDNLKDWISHEVSAHHGTVTRPTSSREQSTSDCDLDLGLSKTSFQPQSSKRITPEDTSPQKCPICLEKDPTFHHIGLHLRRLAVFALPGFVGPDEDTVQKDQGSNIANADDQNSVFSWSTSGSVGKDKVQEMEIDAGNLQGYNPRTLDVGKDVKTTIQAVRQQDKSLGKTPDADSTITRVESDSSLPYHGKSDSVESASIMRQLHSAFIPTFYAQIDDLEPNYRAQPAQHSSYFYWSPPTIKTGYIRRASTLFSWKAGHMHYILANPGDVPLGQIYSAATVFTQSPDTPHLLVVPFDARRSHVYQYPGGWRPLSFRHFSVGDAQHTYSAVTANGDCQHIAAVGSPHWMPQLLPRVYDDQSRSNKKQAGLVGELPLLIALAAFSAPSTHLSTILSYSLRAGKWQPHQYQYPLGHAAERGMVVTIFLDGDNPRGSTQQQLLRLEGGQFGPFYN